MRNHPNLDSLFQLVDDIQDLQKAEGLLLEVFFALDRGNPVDLPLDRRIRDYFEVDDSE